MPKRLRLPIVDDQVIWVHAVSVGEVLAVSGLVSELQRRRPHHKIFISTTTDTGQILARKRFGEERVFHFPMDFAFAIRPWMKALHPKMVVIAETELWPNFLRIAHQSGAQVVVVNARISDRSWPRYHRFRHVMKKLLGHVNLFLAQTETDAARLEDIGVASDRIRITGNLKFDISVPAMTQIVTDLRQALARDAAGPVLVCGSTVEGEEELLLMAFESILAEHPRAVMILAPRHPERFSAVAALLEKRSTPSFKRSAWHDQSLSGAILLLDTIGELAAIYALADVAFVGGSLVPSGGHNIIEPAQLGVAVVVGKHTENFRDIVELFQRNRAVRVATSAELSHVLIDLLANAAERKALGQRAAETLRSQAGATFRTADALGQLLMQP